MRSWSYLLPLVLQGQEGADLEVASSAIDGFRNLAPVVEVSQDLPFLVAVVDDKEFATGDTGSAWHRFPPFRSP
jgi:hypothetical protein